MAAVGDGQHRRALGGGEPGELRAAGNGAVADQQDAVIGIDRLGRLLGAADELDRDLVAAQALDRRGQRRRHALDDDDDRRGARRGGEPDLALDHGAAGERQGRAQMARLCPIRDRPQSAPQAPHRSLPLKRGTVSARGRGCKVPWL